MRGDSTEDTSSMGAGLTYRGSDEGAGEARTMSGDDLTLRVQRLRQVSKGSVKTNEHKDPAGKVLT